MPQVFSPRANALVSVVLAGAALVLVATTVIAAVLSSGPYSTEVGQIPEQPVPFSHQHHVGGLGIECRYCHTGVEQSSFAGVPPTETCMTCHSQLWTNAEMLAPVRESLANAQPLRWIRVHDLADYVYFNHRAHVQNGVGCESCHGRVDKMPLMTQQKPLTMQWCLDCHRDPGPNLRPESEVTAMGYDPASDAFSGEQLIEHYGIPTDTLIECTTCHR